MQQFERLFYLAPELNFIEISVEQGFSLSSMEQIENEKPDQEW